MKPTKPHNSQRGHFTWHLYDEMKANPDIWLITADLGYGQFDAIRDDFPDRFLNVGAAEQTMLDVAVGIAYEGKIPICYSITPFLLYRGFETLRTYIDWEQLNVKLIGGGRNKDYEHDGISHWANDAGNLLTTMLPNIVEYWPDDVSGIERIVKEVISNGKPTFVSLRR